MIIGHEYTSLTVAPTCTQNGYTSFTCSICSDTYTESLTPAAGHEYGPYEVISEATCTTAGLKQAECKSCGITDHVEIPATGHSFENGSCTQCGKNNCSHICHSSNGFVQFIWKIVRFFCSLFKIEKTCSCGDAHY